ncbi:MAG TPA: HmuY family protein [Polyangiaceae bacterium]
MDLFACPAARALGPSSRLRAACLITLGLSTQLGCSSDSDKDPPAGAGGEGNGAAAALELSVDPELRSFVSLKKPALVEVDGDGKSSIAWDLALSGRDVFINGGISGPGNGSAFGPLSAPTYLSDTAPKVPVLLEDRAGGSLLDWYDYAGADHRLYSRYHVYGLRDADRLFKLQILSYYGEQQGAPISALYRIRYAEVLESGDGPIRELAELDATAGGSVSEDDLQSCVDLDNEEVSLLSAAESAASSDWHLCFRREAIAVNGGLSGPRGVESVDLQAAATPTETEAEIQVRSEQSELPAFEAVDYAVLSDARIEWSVDGVSTAIGRRWLTPGSEPAQLSDSVWLVLGADGSSKYLMKFESLSGELGDSTATLGLRAKPVR